MTDPLFWPNRIIESGAANPQELAKGYNELNWRGHPESQRAALEEALDSLGWLSRVIVNKSTGHIIDGHLRVELAVLKGESLVPVDYVELTEDEEALALATLDAITEQAQPIPEKLAALLERTRAMVADKPGLGAMLAELRSRAGVNGKGEPKDAEPQIDKAAQLAEQWGTKLGQIWELGAHRLAVGDCTDKATVEAVMRGERAVALIADPPYGMKLETSRRHGDSTPDFIRAKKNYHPVLGDDKDFDRKSVPMEAIDEFWFGADYYIDTLPNFGKDGSWLVWNKRAEGGNENMQGSMFELIWSKQKHRRELISIVWNGVLGHIKQLDGDEKYHPTQKSVKLIMHIIEQWCGDVVCDPFSGSGTTLIAAQNLARKCRACEIDPGYAAVTLERFHQSSGILPKLVSE